MDFSLEEKALYVSSPPGTLRDPIPRPPNPRIVENALTLAPRSSSWLSVTGVVGISFRHGASKANSASQKRKKGSTPPPRPFWGCFFGYGAVWGTGLLTRHIPAVGLETPLGAMMKAPPDPNQATPGRRAKHEQHRTMPVRALD